MHDWSRHGGTGQRITVRWSDSIKRLYARFRRSNPYALRFPLGTADRYGECMTTQVSGGGPVKAGKKPTAYVFIDEGGNFDFSPNGSRFFFLHGVTMLRPFMLDSAMAEYR